MNESDRHKLACILAQVNESFLIALSNKGLVRRAQKDLAELPAKGLEIEETQNELIVRGADWTVWIPATGPAHARDDTKATGITRQILIATLFAARTWPGPKPIRTDVSETGFAPENVSPEQTAASGAPASTAADSLHLAGTAEAAQSALSSAHCALSPGEEGQALQAALGSITSEDLTKWAGKKQMAEAMAVAKALTDVEIEYGYGVILRLVQHDIELRLLPTTAKGVRLLDQFLSTAPRALHKHYVVLAMIGFRYKAGDELKLAASDVVSAPADGPLTRQDVIGQTQRFLESLLSAGIAHPSTRMIERLYTLSLSASAVHLPRLAYLLRSLADEVSHSLNRDAAADTQRLLAMMSQAHAIARALAAAGATVPRELAGVARTQYDPAGDLQLLGAGCYPWQSQSGVRGLTVLFWDARKQRFLSWSASRPLSTLAQFKFKQVYELETVWAGGGSPARLCRSAFLLQGARINPVGRLSAAQQSSVSEATPLTPATNFDFGNRLHTNWATLRKYANEQFPIGLKVANPLDRIVVLQPGGWGRRFFDEMQQAFCWELVDDKSKLLILTLAWNDTNESAIEFMESLDPGRDRLQSVVARIAMSGSGFAIEPITFISKGTQRGDVILNPAFDSDLIVTRQHELLSRLRKKFGRDRINTGMSSDSEWEEMLGLTVAASRAPLGVRNLLLDTEALLLQVAESGARSLRQDVSQHFQELSDKSKRCGLTELGLSLDFIRSRTELANRLLRAEYLCRLHWQAILQSS